MSDHVELMRRVFELMAADGVGGLVERYDEFCTPDFTWIPATSQAMAGEEHHGKQGLEDWWRAFSESFANVRFHADELREVEDDAVLTLGHTTAEGRASGAPLRWEFSQLNRFRDGKTCWARSWPTQHEMEAGGA